MPDEPLFLYPHQRIIVALDVPTLDEARALIRQLKGHVGMFKFGLQLIYAADPGPLLQLAAEEDVQVMFDAKLHDIPATMKGAVTSITSRGTPELITLHASVGMAGIRAAVAAQGDSHMLGVTVLTSLTEDDCVQIYQASPKDKVLQLAAMLVAAGARGLVCSPLELEDLNKSSRFDPLIRVVPGVRPTWAAADDQARIMTPGKAVSLGATYVVIGRSIRTPPSLIGSPVDAADAIAAEIAAALEDV